MSDFRIEQILLFKFQIYSELIYKQGSVKASLQLMIDAASIYNLKGIYFLHSFAHFDLPPAVKHIFTAVQFNFKWEMKSETKSEYFPHFIECDLW